MFKDFDTTKKQLSDLAEVINKFKSEAVQMRLIELLLDGEPHDLEDDGEASRAGSSGAGRKKKRSKKRATGRKSSAGANGEQESKPRRRASSGSGPVSTLNTIYDSNFFSKPRTIGDICEESKNNYAKTIKPNEISGALGRMVRDKKLKRKKNTDNQYEYSKP